MIFVFIFSLILRNAFLSFRQAHMVFSMWFLESQSSSVLLSSLEILWQEGWRAFFYPQTSNVFMEKYQGDWRKKYSVITVTGWNCSIKFTSSPKDCWSKERCFSCWSICYYGFMPVQLYWYCIPLVYTIIEILSSVSLGLLLLCLL